MNTLAKITSRYQYSAIILKQLVITDFKLRYKGSVLGYLWTLLRPLALFAVMYVVFIHFLKFDFGVPHSQIYLLLGIVLWNYFVEVTLNGMTSIVAKGDLMRKLSFPRYVIVVAGSISALINLVINLLVVLIFMLIDGVDIQWHALMIIPIIIELFLFGLGMSFLLAALFVKLRDLNYVWELAVQAGFYATPIFYPMSLVLSNVSSKIGEILLMNPMAQIIQDARFFLISDKTTTTWGFVTWPFSFVPLIIIIVVMVFSVYLFRKNSPSFAEEI